jgi:hypothetical protein
MIGCVDLFSDGNQAAKIGRFTSSAREELLGCKDFGNSVECLDVPGHP